MTDHGRPPGIPDEAWRRWTQRTKPGAPPPTAPGGPDLRRVAVGDGDAAGGPCDLCGGTAPPFSRLTVDGLPAYVVCAACRATLARLARLTAGSPVRLELR
ncbi:MAG TPA: hypothetical protein VFC93_21265 [Chloroflexota bacterium]|nr:hypothetical protein [Chloroflexota bacterium]